MKIISFVTLLVISSVAIGDSTWSVVIETGEDWLYGLRDCAVLSNGNAVISFAGPFEDPFLMCFDREGSVIWYRHILEKGGTSRAFESDGNLVPLEDGFAACFHSEPRATGIDTDVAVVRMDSSGRILWTYILGEDDEEIWMSTDIISCSDGGLLVSGCPGAQVPGGFVLKLSPNGRLEWMTQPEEISGFALSVTQSTGGDYIVLVFDEYCNGIRVQQISRDGVVSDPVFVSESTSPFSAEIRSFNDFYWIHFSIENNEMLVYRLDPGFSKLHEIVLQLPMWCQAGLEDFAEAGLLLSGSSDDSNALLLFYDFNGNLLWQRSYDIGGEDNFSDASFSNRGVLAVGSTQTYSGEAAFMIVMTDSCGNVEGSMITASLTQLIEPDNMHIELHALGWVLACAVVTAEEDAIQESRDLIEISGLHTGYLWIPDWQSLSGAEGWLIYAMPYMEYDGTLQKGIDSLLEMYPDTYFIWVSQGWDRKTMAIDDFFSR